MTVIQASNLISHVDSLPRWTRIPNTAIDIGKDIQLDTLEKFSELCDMVQLEDSFKATSDDQQTRPTLHVTAGHAEQSEATAIVTPTSECSSIATVTLTGVVTQDGLITTQEMTDTSLTPG